NSRNRLALSPRTYHTPLSSFAFERWQKSQTIAIRPLESLHKMSIIGLPSLRKTRVWNNPVWKRKTKNDFSFSPRAQSVIPTQHWRNDRPQIRFFIRTREHGHEARIQST